VFLELLQRSNSLTLSISEPSLVEQDVVKTIIQGDIDWCSVWKHKGDILTIEVPWTGHWF